MSIGSAKSFSSVSDPSYSGSGSSPGSSGSGSGSGSGSSDSYDPPNYCYGKFTVSGCGTNFGAVTAVEKRCGNTFGQSTAAGWVKTSESDGYCTYTRIVRGAFNCLTIDGCPTFPVPPLPPVLAFDCPCGSSSSDSSSMPSSGAGSSEGSSEDTAPCDLPPGLAEAYQIDLPAPDDFACCTGWVGPGVAGTNDGILRHPDGAPPGDLTADDIWLNEDPVADDANAFNFGLIYLGFECRDGVGVWKLRIRCNGGGSDWWYGEKTTGATPEGVYTKILGCSGTSTYNVTEHNPFP